MRLLEVIKSDHISEDTYQAMMEWGKSVGKTCITCKDTPGFVVNRLLAPYSAEALRMYERGENGLWHLFISRILKLDFSTGRVAH